MINHIDDNNNDAKNDVTIVGTDFFTDSESFLNELTDDELEQVRGGSSGSQASLLLCGDSSLSITTCK